MYQQVNDRIENDKKRVDALANKSSATQTAAPVTDDKPIVK